MPAADPDKDVGDDIPEGNGASHPPPDADTHETASERRGNKIWVLPGPDTPFIESADQIFRDIAPTRTLFVRGEKIVELAKGRAAFSLSIVRSSRFRSLLEGFDRELAIWRSDGKGGKELRPSRCADDSAKALLETTAARTILPPISLLAAAPVIVERDGAAVVLHQGYYDDGGGILVTGGQPVPIVPVREAVAALIGLLAEFNFMSPGDHSRAVASFITPALKLGAIFGPSHFVPIDVAEADQSQSGKTYRQRLICAVYGEVPYAMAQREGGVGSVDESFSDALVRGNPFVQLDNVRGKIASQFLEFIITCDGSASARTPREKNVMVDVTRTLFQMSSNGAESTRDLANRSSIIRIRKRPPGSAFKQYPEGDLLDHVKANQGYYLGCVFAVVREWVRQGKPQTSEFRHDFRRWAKSLDWIVQNLFQAAPLMDGHESAQERVSNPDLTWLRQVALAIERSNRLGESMRAAEILELCGEEGLEVRGYKGGYAPDGHQAIGRIMKKVFGDVDLLQVDEFTVQRSEGMEYHEIARMDKLVKRYQFNREAGVN